VGVDAPSGVDVTAHYLLDAITSASAASGPSGDNIFTEYRNEAGLIMGKTWSRLRLGLAYKYSAESDYWSHIAVASGSYRAWGDSATIAVSLGAGRDQVGRRVQGAAPTPMPGATCMPGGALTCPITNVFGGLGYTQVLSPTAVAQVSYEFALQRGFLASPYRSETLPDRRLRNAASARVAKYLPAIRGGVQLHYRYYWDFFPGDEPSSGEPWGLRTHTFEGRVFQRLGRDLELRLTGRYYPQGPVNFWCDTAATPGCYQGAQFTAAGPQHGPVRTVLAEAKIYWDAVLLRGVPVLGWFSAGTFELSYGRLFQSTMFGDAHLLQTGYTLPF
jgi:hypothetical protein